MSELLRLIATPAGTSGEVRFQVAFAAHAAEAFPDGAAGVLSTGDGQTYALGQLYAPTAVTWREQRVADLATHTYTGAGPFTTTLTWGAMQVQAQVQPQARERRQPAAVPEVALFSIVPVTGQPFQRLIKLRVERLAAGYSLRLDGGAGQVHMLANDGGASQAVELPLDYAKPGSYTVTLDLLDSDGFWLSTLAETPLEVSLPEPTQTDAATLALMQPREIVPQAAAAESTPWLPYRNMRPTRSVATYTIPGGVVYRTVNTSYYLSARAETVAGGKRWYQTALGDWIAADAVIFFAPSQLQGIALDTVQPPTPPPTGTRHGIVTADVLNVRAAPGVSAGNPPIATLRAGAEVIIYEERVVSGATWYRIGENRWVYGAYVRITSGTPPPPPPPPPPTTRRGVVTADVLNVRAAPGVSAGNPPIATLRAGAEVTIYEEQAVSGGLWYRIGESRWVSGSWIRLLEASITAATRAAFSISSPTSLPLGWVVANALNVRAQPGAAASNPPIGQLGHYAPVAVLEQTTVAGVRWFRIGDGQWVEGQQVGVARAKTRPASIGAGTRWVGVCLSEQTFVAYEGDRPVFGGLTASGLPGTPTVQGIFRTWRRLATGKMTGPGYNIEDVTWTCYFYSGYALHTAYWHDSFGTRRSHGCVNLSPHDAWWIYQWSAADGPNSPTVYVYWT